MSRFAGLGASVDKPTRCYLSIPVSGRPPLLSRDGDPAYIDCLSLDSREAGAQRRASAIARLDRRAAKLTADDIEAEQVGMLVALITGWRLYSLAGDPLDVECDEAAKRELMSDPTFAWVRRQVEEHIGDLGNWLSATAN